MFIVYPEEQVSNLCRREQSQAAVIQEKEAVVDAYGTCCPRLYWIRRRSSHSQGSEALGSFACLGSYIHSRRTSSVCHTKSLRH